MFLKRKLIKPTNPVCDYKFFFFSLFLNSTFFSFSIKIRWFFLLTVRKKRRIVDEKRNVLKIKFFFHFNFSGKTHTFIVFVDDKVKISIHLKKTKSTANLRKTMNCIIYCFIHIDVITFRFKS